LHEINTGSFARFCHNTLTLIQIGQQYRGTAWCHMRCWALCRT